MTELRPNFFLEITRAAVTIAGWFILFYKLHQPPTKPRRIAQAASLVLCYTFWMLVPLSDTGNAILWAAMILFFALLSGDVRTSLFTALCYIGMEAAIDTIRHFFIMLIFEKTFRGYTTEYYIQFNLQYLFVLGWTFFYYWVMKNRSWKVPPRFWVMTVIPPCGTAILLTYYADAARAALKVGTNIYIEGILFGVFLLALNLFTFYMYVKLTDAYAGQVFANKLSGVPPVYTREEGFSPVFIKKYDITRREQEVIEAVLSGKSNKEIANTLCISLNTVETHLRHIYQKTDVPNRFALYTLIQS
jgi:DNA-binding CsgD family transcriptional regulator